MKKGTEEDKKDLNNHHNQQSAFSFLTEYSPDYLY